MLLFFLSSLFCDWPVDVEGYFLKGVYMHIGCPHLARYGEYTNNKELETCFTLINLERAQSGIKNPIKLCGKNKGEKNALGKVWSIETINLNLFPIISLWHYQKMIIEARKRKGGETNRFITVPTT